MEFAITKKKKSGEQFVQNWCRSQHCSTLTPLGKAKPSFWPAFILFETAKAHSFPEVPRAKLAEITAFSSLLELFGLPSLLLCQSFGTLIRAALTLLTV